jgi:K+ potassium transporter
MQRRGKSSVSGGETMKSELKGEMAALPPAAPPDGHHEPDRRILLLSLSALGIVYGDIGTSPIYALRECFYGSHPFPPTESNILGVLSLIFWALMIIISLKYLLYGEVLGDVPFYLSLVAFNQIERYVPYRFATRCMTLIDPELLHHRRQLRRLAGEVFRRHCQLLD